jgi:HEAT repeat protein
MGATGEEALRIRQFERDSNVPGLINVLDSEDATNRFAAAQALGRLGNARAIPRLLECLLDDPDKLVRCVGCEALGVLKATEAEDAVIAALQDPDPYIRESAARSLSLFGDVEAIPRIRQALRACLTTETDREVRLAAAYSLLVLGDRDIATEVPAIIKALSLRLRRLNPHVRQLREAAETGQPLAPWRPAWESWGPKPLQAAR